MGRARTMGMIFEMVEIKGASQIQVKDRGKAPSLLKPVKASIAIRGLERATVRILNHNRLPTDRTAAVSAGTSHIDGARDKSPCHVGERP